MQTCMIGMAAAPRHLKVVHVSITFLVTVPSLYCSNEHGDVLVLGA